MLPELPNEVWTFVLNKFERVRDLGRVQQVSRTFNAIIAGVGWTKLTSFETKQCGRYIAMFTKGDFELLLPMEKCLLLMVEMAKKATNITQLQVCCCMLGGDFHEFEEYVKFLGGTLDKLAASATKKFQDLTFTGDLVHLNPVFPSLASFVDAKKETIQHLFMSLNHSPLEDYDPENPALPPELLVALRDCSQLQTVLLLVSPGGPGPLNNQPLLENIINGKKKLENFGVFHWDVPGSLILDSGIQLLEFRTDPVVLKNYAEEMRRRGLKGTDDHPLRTVKKLYIYGGLPPSFSLLPNLERLEAIESCTAGSPPSVVLTELMPLLGYFLTKHEDHPGCRKELTCQFEIVVGAESGQELANVFEDAFSCRTKVKDTNGYTEIVCFLGNATIICEIMEFIPEEGGGMDIWDEELEDGDEEEVGEEDGDGKMEDGEEAEKEFSDDGIDLI